MSNTQWVISKYAKEGDGAEKFEVIEDYPASYLIKVIQNDRWYNLDAPKIEYIPTTPPERWETVPIEECITVVNGRCLVSKKWGGTFCAKNERFQIQDGKLVLQRKVQQN